MKSTVKAEVFTKYRKQILRLKQDQRLFASHSNLYYALFICWQQCGCINPFQVSRRMLMSYSNISSIATYHKCIKDLHAFGYIVYCPSYHPVNGSSVQWPASIS